MAMTTKIAVLNPRAAISASAIRRPSKATAQRKMTLRQSRMPG